MACSPPGVKTFNSRIRSPTMSTATKVGPAAVDGDAVSDPDRLGVEEQEPLLPLLGLRQVLLRQRVALFRDGGDDLVQVRDLAAAQVEDVLAAARGQRLEHRRPIERLEEGLEPRLRARHQRAGPDVGWE